MNPSLEYLLAARGALNAGDPRRAYTLVTTGILSEPGRVEPFLAAAECLRWLGQAQLAGLYELAAVRPTDPEAVLGLAQNILATGDAPLAMVLSNRALELRPDWLGAVGLLALAYAADFRPADGRDALLNRKLLDFDSGYILAWCSLMCGEIVGVMDFIEVSRADLRRSPLPHHDQVSREEWLDHLEDCLARRVTVEEPAQHVRPWHFIQYGSAILDCSADTDGAGGRFTATWQSYRQIAALVKALFDLLVRLDRRPTKVLAASDRDSQIVGRLAAEFLEVRCEAAGGGTDLSRALVVAAHGRDLQALPLDLCRHGQTVFALDFDWLAPGPVVPDVCGMLSLSCTLPWHVETRIAGATSQASVNVPGEGEVVRRLLAAAGDTNASATAAISFYAERAGDIKGKREGSRRLRFRRDSPVPASGSWRGHV